MENNKIVSRNEWMEARKQLLEKEKELTRLQDKLSAERRQQPWVKVEKNYVFDGPKGKETLADLFDAHSQLFVYHFMFGPDFFFSSRRRHTRFDCDWSSDVCSSD